mmetsp:Transcript_31993/g.90811  ORF Transcript_31993/g.90811 Transcript_31993/m.90811 type:complete len:191 (+) Transcript_31993:102-674(+)|eukprot:CAMPEP_0117670074 /NCGR_PEP_ID=MMETSP0804-20121206/12524_1 /TAXON_ID=1074897 /ORGANISM="Tetraselmis astigmatica, Strain CCMP880" /LENGTH=190 /DNA_ID=CAMNT_0005478279 /DNA_START=304 /DNA_END=876 /DNA_ORIENTATION=-
MASMSARFALSARPAPRAQRASVRARASAEPSTSTKTAMIAGPTNYVELRPCFEVTDEKNLEAFKGTLGQFTKLMEFGQESDCLHYGFTSKGSTFYCCEAYKGADALINHIQRVGPTFKKALELCELKSLQAHGPAEELAKIKEALSDLPIEYFEAGFYPAKDPLAGYNDPLEAYCKDNEDADECRVYED